MRNALLSPVLVMILAASGIAHADTVSLSAVSRGSYNQTGAFSTGFAGTASGNYVTGNYLGNVDRSFFTFSLPTVSGSVTSAQLQISTTAVIVSAFGAGPSPVTFDLYAYSGDSTALDAGTAGVAGFGALASGTLLASVSIPTAEAAGTIISIDLNADALSALQASQGSLFSFGGSLTSTVANNFIFGNSSTTTTQLVINTGSVAATPEPSSLILLGTGVLGILGAARRRLRVG